MTIPTDTIREAVADAIEPRIFRDNLMGSLDRRRIALEFADTVIAAHLTALEAQGHVVAPRPPTAEEGERALEDFYRWVDEITPDCTARALKAFGDLLPAASNQETGQ